MCVCVCACGINREGRRAARPSQGLAFSWMRQAVLEGLQRHGDSSEGASGCCTGRGQERSRHGVRASCREAVMTRAREEAGWGGRTQRRCWALAAFPGVDKVYRWVRCGERGDSHVTSELLARAAEGLALRRLTCDESVGAGVSVGSRVFPKRN